jgi:phosphatidylserine/phosphatidylglycerophosphate/cardiolipin synthase-like enzyme
MAQHHEKALESEFVMGGDRPAAEVAGLLVDFIAGAQRSLDVAIYDFDAKEGEARRVAAALEAAASRGVAVRVAFNADYPHRPSSPRPPKTKPETIEGLSVPTRPVSSDGALMHHKFIVRDRTSVWTGSMNWTDDAFRLEENVLLKIGDERIAAEFTRNFEQLWSRGTVEGTGGIGAEVSVAGATVKVSFSPDAPSLANLAASVLAEGHHRVRILSPVMTSGAVLGTLAELAARPNFDLIGAYDLTQMEEVQRQWLTVPTNRWKLEAWKVIAPRLSGKRSTPYGPGAVHDYMHAKLIVANGHVLAGSYNLSRHGEKNAENVVHIRGGNSVERFAAFAEKVAARYADSGGSGVS